MKKIGIDIDGTITECPFIFSALAKGLLADDHEVHIITYRQEEERGKTIKELADYDIPYTVLHMAKAQDEMGAFKASVAEEVGIDVMFDDSLRCLLAMPKGVKQFWTWDANVTNSAPMMHIARHLGAGR